MKNLLLALGLLYFINAASGQHIHGVITDGINHQPLSFCTVSLLKAADSSQVKSTLADEGGAYHFENIKTGQYLLSARMVGYLKKLVPVNLTRDVETLNLELVPQTKQLNDVVIKATKPIIERRADRIIFNVENSIVAAGNNGMELLKMAPMITTSPTGGLSLNGKENVMIMLDGKIIPAETAGNLLQSLSAEQIAKIELITSPPAKYDASAIGGIINVITKKGTGMGLNGSVNTSASRSNYGRYNTGLSLNYRNSRFNVYGNLNFRDGESYKNETFTRYLQTGNQLITQETPTQLFGNSKAESVKAGVDYTLTKTSVIGFTFDGLFSQADHRATASSYFRNAANQLDSVLTSASRPGGNVKYTSYDLNYKNTFNGKGQELVIDMTHSRYSGLTRQDLAAEMIHIATPQPAEESSSITRTLSLFHITTFQADYTYPVAANTILETGVKETNTNSGNQSTGQDGSQPESLSNTAYTENIAAGYLTLTRQLKTLKLQAGLRAEQANTQLSNTGIATSALNLFPGALIEQKFSDRYQVSLAYTSHINRPAYEALIPFVVPIDNYTQEKGNPNLKPEYASSFELTNTLGSVSLTLGYTHTKDAIQDFIEQDLATKVWTFTKSNFTRMENYNAALVVPYSVTPWWNSNNTLSGAYNNYYAANAGGDQYNRGKFGYNLNSINTFLLPRDIKAELMAVYNSANIYGLYEISHSSAINAGFSRAFLEKKLNIKLGVNDIFHDSGYHLNTNTGSIRLDGTSYTDSRRFTLSVSYKFGRKIAAARQINKSNETEQGRLNL